MWISFGDSYYGGFGAGNQLPISNRSHLTGDGAVPFRSGIFRQADRPPNSSIPQNFRQLPADAPNSREDLRVAIANCR